jgi:hypothetical protein
MENNSGKTGPIPLLYDANWKVTLEARALIHDSLLRVENNSGRNGILLLSAAGG